MNFLQPWGLLGLSALIPVIALYFLKLKREERVVPSTLLWKKVIDDLQVNAPFQRLKYSLLLLLQMLLVSVLGFALARPYLSLPGYSGQRLLLLIDTSASMGTKDAGKNGDMTRLEAAIRDAENKAGDLRASDGMMIVAFDRDVRQLTPKFTSDRGELKRILRTLHPRDLVTRADEAFETALALTENDQNAKVLVLSDGCFGELKMLKERSTAAPAGNLEDKHEATPMEKLARRLNNFRFVCYGDKISDNVGITQIDARTRPVRRTGEDGKRVDVLETQVFVMVENFSPKPKDVVLTLSVTSLDQKEKTDFPPKAITLKGRPEVKESLESAADGKTSENSRSVEVFKLPIGTKGIIKATLIASPKDRFAADDTACVVIGRVDAIKLLLVSKGNYFLEKAFAAMRGVTVTSMQPDEFLKQWDQKAQQVVEPYDLCVFDEVAPIAWPEGGALFIGAMPPLPGFEKEKEPLKGPDVVTWDSSHPAMRYVLFSNVDIAEAQSWKVPKTAKLLVETNQEKPLVVSFENDRVRVVGVTFGIFNSNWVLRSSLPLFLRNTIPWLAEVSSRRHPAAQQTGEPLMIPPVQDAPTAMLHHPDETESPPERVDLSRERSTFVKGTDKAGIYRVTGLPGEPDGRPYVFNLASHAESDNAARQSLDLGAVTLASSPSAIEAKREVWRDLALAAGAILLLEWWVYHRRVGI